MKFSEADLHRLSGRARWSVERGSLTVSQLDSLVAIVKHLVPDAKRAEFKLWLNEAVAQYVENVRKRQEGQRQVSGRTLRRPRNHPLSQRRAPKLSTRVRDEMKEIRRAVQDVTYLMDDLSQPAREAIKTYIWKKHLVGRTHVRQEPIFRKTWKLAHDALILFQVACERSDEVGIRLACQVRAELAKVSQSVDALVAVIEGMSDPTRRAFESSYKELNSGQSGVDPTGVAIEEPLRDALDWLTLIESIAARIQIDVRRGRDEVPLKTLVAGLAELCCAMTGKEPGRVYRAVRTRGGNPVGETGNFLEFVRLLVKYAHEAAPGIGMGSRTSLSKVVREVLEERRTALTA